MPNYNSFFKDIADNNIDLGADTIKVMLVQAAYTPDRDAHNRRDDVTDEASGTGYTAGGATLANVTTTQDDTNDLMKFDADDVVWTTVTVTFRYLVFYKSRGGAASADELIGYIDTGGNQTVTGANLTLQWHTNGIMRFKQAA
jgi:hypothetical protein